VEVVASLAPRADVVASTRKLPARKPASGVSADFVAATASATGAAGAASADVVAGTPADPRRVDHEGFGATSQVDPARPRGATAVPVRVGVSGAGGRNPSEVELLSPDRYRYQLTIGGATLEKLRLASARSALRGR
jgi:hypothetical protein